MPKQTTRHEARTVYPPVGKFEYPVTDSRFSCIRRGLPAAERDLVYGLVAHAARQRGGAMALLMTAVARVAACRDESAAPRGRVFEGEFSFQNPGWHDAEAHEFARRVADDDAPWPDGIDELVRVVRRTPAVAPTEDVAPRRTWRDLTEQERDRVVATCQAAIYARAERGQGPPSWRRLCHMTGISRATLKKQDQLASLYATAESLAAQNELESLRHHASRPEDIDGERRSPR